MSRIGRAPIEIPAGVTVTIADDNTVTVKGPKGELVRTCHKDMIIKLEDNVLTVARPSEDKLHRSLHGLTRSLLHNMVVGVTDGFAKNLEPAVPKRNHDRFFDRSSGGYYWTDRIHPFDKYPGSAKSVPPAPVS